MVTGTKAVPALTFAFNSSTMKWHSEAFQKYSFALYFRSGLSIVLVATWWESKYIQLCSNVIWCRNHFIDCVIQTHKPARRFQWLLDTVPAVHSKSQLSEDICWQSWKKTRPIHFSYTQISNFSIRLRFRINNLSKKPLHFELVH